MSVRYNYLCDGMSVQMNSVWSDPLNRIHLTSLHLEDGYLDHRSGGGGGAFEDALEFSESGSFASCLTPHGSGGGASVFHSVENSPEKQQLGSGASTGSSSRQRQQQQSPAGGRGEGSGGGGKPKYTPPRKPASRS